MYGMDFLSVCQVLQVVASLPHEHLGHLLSDQRHFVLVFATPSSLRASCSAYFRYVPLPLYYASTTNNGKPDAQTYGPVTRRGPLNNHETEHTMCTVSRACPPPVSSLDDNIINVCSHTWEGDEGSGPLRFPLRLCYLRPLSTAS